MTDTELIEWMDWYVRGEFTLNFEEEDGGIVMLLNKGEFIGLTVRECLEQAANYLPMETTL